MYINGVAQTVTDTSGGTITSSSTPVMIGGFWASGATAPQDDTDETLFEGYIDEFRISVGIVRWIEDFDDDLPVRPYSDYPKKIAVEVGDTGVECYVEIERWDGTAEEAQLWVKVPSISSSADTVLNLYYDSAHADNDLVDADSYTKLLLESNTTDGSTTFVDSSPDARTVSVTGQVHHEVDQKKFGATSIQFDGSGDYLTVPDHADFAFGTGDFTIDAWVRSSSFSQHQDIVTKRTNGYGPLILRLEQTTGKPMFYGSYNGTSWATLITSTTACSLNTWHHVAIVREGSTFTLYLDGVSVATDTNSGSLYVNTLALSVGATSTGDKPFTGYFDEVRVSKGIARWTTDFDTDLPIKPYRVSYVGYPSEIPAQLVWDDNFVGVWHMNQDPSGTTPQILDSTSGRYHGTSVGTMTASDLVAGAIGDGTDFDGTDDYLTGGDIAAMDTMTAMTVEAYYDPVTWVNGTGIVSKNEGSTDYAGFILNEHSTSGDYRLYAGFGSTGAGTSAVETSSAPLAPVFLAGTIDSSNLTLWLDGTKGTPATTDSDYSLDGGANPFVIGTNSHSLTDGITGVIDEVRVSDVVRSDAWLKATYFSNTDNFVSFYDILTPIFTFTNQYYSITEAVNTVFVNQFYGLKDVIFNDQYYSLTDYLLAIKNQIYGLKDVIINNHFYGDGPVLIIILNQYYGDTVEIKKMVTQLYGNYDGLKKSNIQTYSLAEEIIITLIEEYSLTLDQILSYSDQLYDLNEYNNILKQNEQPYALLGDTDIISSSISITSDGWPIDYINIDIEGSLDRFCLTCDIQVASQEDYLKCNILSDIVVIIDGQTYNFFIESRGRRKSHGSIAYNIECISHTAKLGQPYASSITDSFLTGTAKSIVTSLASPYTIDWQLNLNDQEVDWPITGEILATENEYPIEIIKKLVNAVGGKVQTTPEGVLTLINHYPDSVNTWETASSDFTLSDLDHFFSTDETFSARDGYNVFLISDKVLSTDSLTIEERVISETQKELHVYQTPFDINFALTMKTSGGSWVDIGVGETVLEEIPYNPDDPTETELVEIVNGYGQLNKPYYGHNTYNADGSENLQWLETELGIASIQEDGTIECTTLGQSLIRLRYFTKYHKWDVSDARIEDVQFYLEE